MRWFAKKQFGMGTWTLVGVIVLGLIDSHAAGQCQFEKLLASDGAPTVIECGMKPMRVNPAWLDQDVKFEMASSFEDAEIVLEFSSESYPARLSGDWTVDGRLLIRSAVSFTVASEASIIADYISIEAPECRLDGVLTATHGEIRIEADALHVSGELQARIPQGRIVLLGERITLTGASLDVSAPGGDGMIIVGGVAKDAGAYRSAVQTMIDRDTVICADAIGTGDGGRVDIWSTERTVFDGTISARGGASGGDGGTVEVSGLANLKVRGSIDITAPAGAPGHVTFDPGTITVGDFVFPASGDGEVADGTVLANEPDTVTDIDISHTALLAIAGPIFLESTNDTIFNDPLSLTAGNLTVSAQGGVVEMKSDLDVFFDLTLIGPVNFTNAADQSLTAGGTLTLDSTATKAAGDLTFTALQMTLADGNVITGNLLLNAGSIEQFGNLAAGGDIEISGNLTTHQDLCMTSGNQIEFFGRVDSLFGTPFNLNLDAPLVIFNDRVGGDLADNTLFSNVTVTGASTINTDIMTALNSITFNGDVISAQNVTMTAALGGVTFQGRLDSQPSQFHDLILNSSNATFFGQVGNSGPSTALGLLRTGINPLLGRTLIDADVVSALDLDFNNPVIIGSNAVTLIGSFSVNFAGELDSEASEFNDVTVISNNVIFQGPVGLTNPLGALDVPALGGSAVSALDGGWIEATTSINFGQRIVIGQDTTLVTNGLVSLAEIQSQNDLFNDLTIVSTAPFSLSFVVAGDIGLPAPQNSLGVLSISRGAELQGEVELSGPLFIGSSLTLGGSLVQAPSVTIQNGLTFNGPGDQTLRTNVLDLGINEVSILKNSSGDLTLDIANPFDATGRITALGGNIRLEGGPYNFSPFGVIDAALPNTLFIGDGTALNIFGLDASLRLIAERVDMNPNSSLTISTHAETRINCVSPSDLLGTVSLGPGAFLHATADVTLGGRPPIFTDHDVYDIMNSRPRAAVATDVNGDGNLDVVAANSSSNEITLSTGDTATPPGFATNTINAAVSLPVDLAVADINGNGPRDVVVCSFGDNRVVWLDNDGNITTPTFTLFPVSNSEVGPTAVVVADIDGDGPVDIVVASAGGGTVVWLENDGTLTPLFTRHVVSSTLTLASSIHVADVDNDGDLDLLAGGNNELNWYDSDGLVSPTFTQRAIAATPLVSFVRGITTADLDGDGDLDILSVSQNASVAWHESDGALTPSFTTHVIGTPAGPISVAVDDMDGDGDLDVVVGVRFGETVLWYENRGGTPLLFTEQTVATTLALAQPVVSVLDIDGDGDRDVLWTDFDQVRWSENTLVAGGGTLLQSGALLACDGTILNGGMLTSFAGTLAPSGLFTNAATVQLYGGIVDAPAGIVNTGRLEGYGNLFGPTTNDGIVVIQADMQIVGDYTNNFSTTVQNGTLTILGTLTNNGTLTGDFASPAAVAMKSAVAGGGMFVEGDFVAGAVSSLLMASADATFRAGGAFDVAIDDSARFHMSLATLQMAGLAGQTLEVMSEDIGNSDAGLDRIEPGRYPIGTLRIGPTTTSVTLVDTHDNDGLGQVDPEALYISNLIIEPGATLITDGFIVYYETLSQFGAVDEPLNLIQLIDLCPADINGNGTVNVTDLLALLAAWGPCPPDPMPCQSDNNGDGNVNVTDLLALLAAWGACP